MRTSELIKLEKLLDMGKPKDEIIEEMRPKRNGGNNNQAPEGGISLRQAERKYGIDNSTLSRWAKRGWVKILDKTANWLYIDENDLIRTIKERRG